MTAQNLDFLDNSIRAFKNIIHGMESIKIFTEDIITAGPYFFLIVDKDLNIYKANDLAAKTLNIDANTAVGKNIINAEINVEARELISNKITEGFNGDYQTTFDFEVEIQQDPQSVYFNFNCQLIGKNLRLTEDLLVLVGTDVSAMKQLMGEKIKNMELSFQHQLLETALQNSSSIQQMLIPEVENDKDRGVQMSVLYKPSEYVGGDFWWSRKFEESDIFIVCDVMGHGVASGMLGSFMNGYVQCFFDNNQTINAALVKGLNDKINELTKHEYSSTFGAVEIDSENIHLWNAGGLFPLLVTKDGEIERPTMRSGTLGLDEVMYYDMHLARDDYSRIIWFTDGFGDFRGKNGRHYSRKKLNKFIDSLATVPREEAMEQVENFIETASKKYEIADDISFAIIDLTPVQK